MIDAAERLSKRIEDGIRSSMRGRLGRSGVPTARWARTLADLLEKVVATGGPALADVLADALPRAAEHIDEITLAVTGAGWLGGGTPSVERTLSELIASAQQEILVTAYSVTPGSERIWDEIERALATGIRTTIVVDRIAGQCEEARLLLDRLARSYPETLALYDFISDDAGSGLHAKVLVVDRRLALVGSANLSHRGMVTAHEMAAVVQGPTADRVAARVDALIGSPFVLRVSGSRHAL